MLSGLTSLTTLYLDDNSITDVEPLADLVNLEKLYLSGNDILNLFILLSLTADIDIAVNPTIRFPDTGLDGAIRSALGLAADDDINISELETLTRTCGSDE